MGDMRHRMLLLGALAFLTACGNGSDDDRVAVAVSVLPQANLVERIAGDRVRVVVLVEPGQSPATYQPTDRQVSEVAGAEVYFRIGVPFENGRWLEALTRGGARTRVVDLREGLTLREMERHAHHGEEHGHDEHGGEEEGHEDDGHDEHGHEAHEGSDPHVWLEPSRLRVMAATIARALEEIDPEGAATYRERLAELDAELVALEAEIREALEPYRGRRVYVFHPAWGYFCDAFGLKQVAVEIEGKEPSESEITELLRSAREDGIRAIYVQPQIAGTAVQAVARALDVEVRTLDPLAPDVLANLRSVARSLADGWR
jgi:zinc transport system substrate-binding protein